MTGEINTPELTTTIHADDLEHMAEILADTLPLEPVHKFWPVMVGGIGWIGFTATGTYADMPNYGKKCEVLRYAGDPSNSSIRF